MLDVTAPRDWETRNQHWEKRAQKVAGRQAARQRNPHPIILCGHGVSLSVDRGTLLVRNGLTHYPQERETYRFFRGGQDLPSRIIVLDGSGNLSFDVLSWLSEQKISLTRIDWKGDVVTVVGGSGFPLIQEKVRWQIATRDDPEQRLAFSKELIFHKLNNSSVTLRQAVPDSSAKDLALARAERSATALAGAHDIDQLRMIEAQAAASYFAAWKGVQLRWERLAKFPIPEDWKTVGSRGARRPTKTLGNRHATHPVNAILNYAYAVLRSHVQIEAVVEGFDPTLGIMHHSRPDATAFIYDMMEVGRPIIDAQVLRFIQTEALRGSDFVLRADGVVRLAPQLLRALCSKLAPPAISVPDGLECVPDAAAQCDVIQQSLQ